MVRGATNEAQMSSVAAYSNSIQPQYAMMNEERVSNSNPENARGGRGGYSGGDRGGYGQQYQRRGDESSHVVYKNSKMNKKDFEKK
jgi:hypothetical protein